MSIMSSVQIPGFQQASQGQCFTRKARWKREHGPGAEGLTNGVHSCYVTRLETKHGSLARRDLSKG